MAHIRIVVTTAAGLVLFASAQAQIMFNDFPAGDGYSATQGYAAYGGSPFFTSAFQFASAASGQVGQITVGLDYSGGTNSFALELFADSAGAPGTMLGSWNDTSAPSGTTVQASTVNVTGGPTLTGGTTYWFAIAAGSSSTTGSWGQNIAGASNPRVYMNASGGAWNVAGTNTTGAFRIQAVAAPEPASLAACGIGIAALLKRRRKS